MTVKNTLNSFITEYNEKIDLTFEDKLNDVKHLKTNNKNIEAINLLKECSDIARKNHVELEYLQIKYLQLSGEIFGSLDDEISRYKQMEADFLVERAELTLSTKNLNKSEVAWACIWAAVTKYKQLITMGKTGRIAYRDRPGVYCETESPFYIVKKYLRNGISLFDEVSADCLAKNDFQNAFLNLSILGELFLHEIYIGKKIEDDFLYSVQTIGELFYNAGESFLRSFRVMKDRYLTTMWVRPMLPPFMIRDVMQFLFQTGRSYIDNDILSVKCFENAKNIFYQTGSRRYYLLSKDKLSELKQEKEDFEYVVSNAFFEISRGFCTNRATFFEYVASRDRIKETSIRDYFLSHIKLLIKWIAVSEEPRLLGRTDLSIHKKDEVGINCLIAEFKIWGRKNYLNVVSQLRGYLTDFERFGIVVMINQNKWSIKEKYIEKIIKKDSLFITDSLREERFHDSNFIYLASKHHTNSNKSKVIDIYHILLDIEPLMADL